jgi:dUTPase
VETKKLKITKYHRKAVIPTKEHPNSVGHEISIVENVTIQVGQNALVATGLHIDIPHGHYIRVVPRNRMGYQHMIGTNTGIINTKYEGDIKVLTQIVSISENRESLYIILYLTQIVSIYVYMWSVLCSKGKLSESLYLRE